MGERTTNGPDGTRSTPVLRSRRAREGTASANGHGAVPEAPIPRARGSAEAPTTELGEADGARAPRWSAWAALLWSAGAVLLAFGWASGLLAHPFGEEERVAVGALVNATDPSVGMALVLTLGVVGTVCAAVAAKAREQRTLRATAATGWLITGTTAFGLIHGGLLSLMGYTLVVPVAGWWVPGLASVYGRTLIEPDSLLQLYVLLGVVVWGWASLHAMRAHADACRQCGRTRSWSQTDEARIRTSALRTGRVAVTIAFIAALAYPSIRLPWLFGIYPGFGERAFEQLPTGTLFIGVGLGLAGLGGGLLMLGLVQRWGVRFPRRLPGLSGRRVPITLAVVPATLVSIALLAMGKALAAGWVTAFTTGETNLLTGGEMLHSLVFLAMPVWGTALGVATAAYAVRRRAECRSCGQGEPEVTDLRGTART